MEVSADVIALRQEFSIPADDRRFRVIHADGAAYVVSSIRIHGRGAGRCVRSQSGIATQFDSTDFYRNARNCLAPGGVFVTNVCGDDSTCADHLTKLRAAFDNEVLTLRMSTWPQSHRLRIPGFTTGPVDGAAMR